MRVLYIDGVGPFGGASRSLLEAVNAMPCGEVSPLFLAAEGTALERYRQIASGVVATRAMTRFDNTAFSHYRGKRWLVGAAQSAFLPMTWASVVRARIQFGSVDLLHGNETTDIIPLLMAQRIFQVPAIIHVRALMSREQNKRTRWLNNRLREMAAVIAIDENVRLTLPMDIPVQVVHNSFTLGPRKLSSNVIETHLSSLRQNSLKVGFVGNLHYYKGIIELVQATKLVVDAGRDIEIVVIGGHTRSNRLHDRALEKLGMLQDAGFEAKALVQQLGLQEHVHFLGATDKIQQVYEGIDVLCFATHLDAPGRPVLEAASVGVPSIVAVKSPMSDTFANDETGIGIPDASPHYIAQAIMRFADDRSEVRRMGANARALAEANFSPKANSAKLLSVYRQVLKDNDAALIRNTPE